MPASADGAADLVDGRDHRAAHRECGVAAVLPLEGCGRPREQRAAPAAVAPRCAEAGDLLLEHDDLERGIALLQVPRRPQAGQAASDDRDVGIRVAGERRARGERALGERVVPEREAAVVASPVIASRPMRCAGRCAAMASGPIRQHPPIRVAPSATHSCTRSPGSCDVPVQVAAVAVPHLAAVRVGQRRQIAGRRAATVRAPETSLASQQFTPTATTPAAAPRSRTRRAAIRRCAGRRRSR